MPKIKYKPSGFPPGSPSNLLNKQDLNITLPELIWGCISVGKFGLFDITYFGVKSFHEIFFKLHLFYANLDIDISSGRFIKSSLYDTLDPSEKAVVSYYLGMACTKVFSYKFFNTPWLYHLSNINLITITFMPGDSRPDLIGQDVKGNWIVVEAKGRTNGYCSKTMQVAKKQTKQINQINGKNPILRVAFQSHFNKHLELAVEDPPEPDSNAKDLNFDGAIAIRDYYKYLVNLLKDSNLSQKTIHGSIRIIEFHENGLTIGLLESIIEAWDSDNDLISIREKLGLNSLLTTDRNNNSIKPEGDDSSKINQDIVEQFFNDGIYISLKKINSNIYEKFN